MYGGVVMIQCVGCGLEFSEPSNGVILRDFNGTPVFICMACLKARDVDE